MISATLYYVTRPIRACLHKRSREDGGAPHVQAGGQPSCTQKLGNYGKAIYAGVQKFGGQVLSVTASELNGGAMPLLGTAISESKGPETALIVGVPVVLILNTASSWHAASVVQDAFGLSSRARTAVFIVSSVLPLVEIFALADVDKDDPLKIPVVTTYLILGRMLTNALRDFFNEFGKGALGDTKHADVHGIELGKPDIVSRRGTRLVLSSFPDNVGSAALGQFVVKNRIKDRFNVSDIATDSVAELVLVGERWKDTATSALSSGVVKGCYAFWGEWTKAYAAGNDTKGGTLIYVKAKGFKALRENFGPKSKDAFQRWKDATCTRNLLGPLSDSVSIWSKMGGGGTPGNVVASLVGGVTEMRTPLLVDRAQAGRETKRATMTVAVNLPDIVPPTQPQRRSSGAQPSDGAGLDRITRDAAVYIASKLEKQSNMPVDKLSASATTAITITPTCKKGETIVTVLVRQIQDTSLLPSERPSQPGGAPSGSRGSDAQLLRKPSSLGMGPDDPEIDIDLPGDEAFLLPGAAMRRPPETRKGQESPDEID
ncbi:MAG: hypothetical protein AB7P37_18160 [Ramlibacter sp.]